MNWDYDIVAATANWPWERIIAAASLVIAALAAFAAFRAARATQKAAEAGVLLTLLTDYAAPEMLDALRTLRRWRESAGDNFAKIWASELGSGVEQALAVDRARRHVGSYFDNADRLHQAGLISQETLRAAVDKAGLALLFQIVAQLEPRLYPEVDLSFIARLRQLCSGRVQQDLISLIPLSGQGTSG